jgi:hypothetical protein
VEEKRAAEEAATTGEEANAYLPVDLDANPTLRTPSVPNLLHV